jgi:L-fucose isomerase
VREALAVDALGGSLIRQEPSGAGGAISEKVLPYVRAASATARLRGKMFGLFGGRSLGIDTGTFDPMQWRRQFGVDVQHIDQLEIVRRAEGISDEEAEEMTNWLEASVGTVAYDGQALTRDKLAYQARCYMATKRIIEDMGLDFVAIKCMPDLTNHYIPQCLTAALLPGPYDFEGDKEPTVMACEADGDAALTMEILKSVSGGKATLFGDVSYIDLEAQMFYLPNCGGMCTWYANRSSDPKENLKQVELRPSMRPSGGAITYLTAASGPMTLARLYRRAGQYRMAILSGEATQISQEAYQTFVAARGKHQLPTAFVKLSVDVDAFISEFGSNHITGVAGTYVEELRHVCQMLDITPVVMTAG